MLQHLKRLFPTPPATPARKERRALDAAAIADVFVIGDVHGRLDLLRRAEEAILATPAEAGDGMRLVVTLGDYIDRGPDSRQVLDHLITPLPAPFSRISLCGNHDDVFLSYLAAMTPVQPWLETGGDATLMSYGIDARHMMKMDPDPAAFHDAVRAAVPARHADFLRELPVALEIGDFLFVHAGIRPGLALDEQSDQDLMWIREPFLSQGPGGDRIVVHGHTPSPDIVFGPQRIGMDTGAFMTSRLPVLQLMGLSGKRRFRIIDP